MQDERLGLRGGGSGVIKYNWVLRIALWGSRAARRGRFLWI